MKEMIGFVGGPIPAPRWDPRARIDFAYRNEHLTTLPAKALVAHYYDQAEKYAYFASGARASLRKTALQLYCPIFCTMGELV